MTEADLASYQLQLQQVEAALIVDAENAELRKLQEDLNQVIDLTKELISAAKPSGAASHSKQAKTAEERPPEAEDDAADEDVVKDQEVQRRPVKHWQVGEQCQAMWSLDGLYYEAIIEEITTDGQVLVRFKKHQQMPGSGTTATTSLGLLRVSSLGYTGTSSSLNKKEQLAKQREYLKKKKAKKAEKLKQREQDREDEKNKWQNFTSKAMGKKGVVKRSIFKTPETAKGRVGIGTCGVSGLKMTTYNAATKNMRR